MARRTRPHIETKIFGDQSREWLISYGDERILTVYQIIAVGWVEAREGFSVYRTSPNRSALFASLAGTGEVLVRGEWKLCKAGMVYLAPPGQLMGYRVDPNLSEDCWHCCWIECTDDGIIQVAEPTLITGSAVQLYRAIQGLYDEHYSQSPTHCIANWVDLILHYGKQLGHPALQKTALLRPLWEKVINDFAHPWTVARLVQESLYSEETLRRICLAETGFAPKEYVTFLRMRRAASLLASNHSHSIQSVALTIGYTDPFAFSTAFRRIMGVAPSLYRKNMLSSSPTVPDS